LGNRVLNLRNAPAMGRQNQANPAHSERNAASFGWHAACFDLVSHRQAGAAMTSLIYRSSSLTAPFTQALTSIDFSLYDLPTVQAPVASQAPVAAVAQVVVQAPVVTRAPATNSSLTAVPELGTSSTINSSRVAALQAMLAQSSDAPWQAGVPDNRVYQEVALQNGQGADGCVYAALVPVGFASKPGEAACALFNVNVVYGGIYLKRTAPSGATSFAGPVRVG
jgi:hypothetical protein